MVALNDFNQHSLSEQDFPLDIISHRCEVIRIMSWFTGFHSLLTAPGSMFSPELVLLAVPSFTRSSCASFVLSGFFPMLKDRPVGGLATLRWGLH